MSAGTGQAPRCSTTIRTCTAHKTQRHNQAECSHALFTISLVPQARLPALPPSNRLHFQPQLPTATHPPQNGDTQHLSAAICRRTCRSNHTSTAPCSTTPPPPPAPHNCNPNALLPQLNHADVQRGSQARRAAVVQRAGRTLGAGAPQPQPQQPPSAGSRPAPAC